MDTTAIIIILLAFAGLFYLIADLIKNIRDLVKLIIKSNEDHVFTAEEIEAIKKEVNEIEGNINSIAKFIIDRFGGLR